MAIYKCLPNYVYARAGVKIRFNLDGAYETNDPAEIALLDGLAPFIQAEKAETPAKDVKPEEPTEPEDSKPAKPKAEATTKK